MIKNAITNGSRYDITKTVFDSKATDRRAAECFQAREKGRAEEEKGNDGN